MMAFIGVLLYFASIAVWTTTKSVDVSAFLSGLGTGLQVAYWIMRLRK